MATTEERIHQAAPHVRADQIVLTIDDREVVCDKGDSLLEAAQKAGIHVPTLCYEPRLPSSAACRVCMVEVEGARRLVASCATAAADGMVVHTQSEKARQMRHLYLELLLSDHNSFCTPPCRDACPTHIKIPQFLDFIAHGDYRNGVRKLREDLPFPAILGRVCPRPCEGPCRRQLVEHPITICWLHRFMADQCLDDEQTGELLLPVEPKPDTGKRIAVIGAGPAGLACAFYARLEGHAVKVFEAMPKPGGMLRYGIPSYRLPRDVIDKEFNVLWRLGIELQCDSRLGEQYELEDLLAVYDAVFLALGAFNSNEMGVESEDADGVVTAVDFLGELELNGTVHVGEKVTVIGGGFTAMDACRTAVRMGAGEVTCLYRRSRKEMPAHHTEVDEAEEEGVRLELLTAPVKILTDDAGKVIGIEMLRMELGEPDASGRRRPVPIEGSNYIVECDQVITAIGQFPKLDGTSEEQGVKRTKWKTIGVDQWTLQTEDPRVFAGGDAVLGAQTVIQAVAQGKKAAWSIDAFLRGEEMTQVSRDLGDLNATPFIAALSARSDLDPRIARMAEIRPVFVDMTTDVSHPAPPAEMPKLTPDYRRANFEQIELGFPEGEARRGASLCLDCYCPANGKCDLQRHSIDYEVFKNRFHGQEAHDYPADFRHDFIMREPNRCINCMRCVRVCRMEVGASCYDAMGRGYDSIVSTADNLPLQMVGCVSCGKCAETCPTGSIETNPRLLESYKLDESRCMFCGECVEVCPYDALEQTDFFELAGYDRAVLATESLFVRQERPVDPLREAVTDLVPHVSDVLAGEGWEWTAIKAEDLPEEAEADQAATGGNGKPVASAPTETGPAAPGAGSEGVTPNGNGSGASSGGAE
jgi:NADPH-dependent glutamate synthase beta subunit-like oxidoreductase/formate hydrogenlyase subunit 6/NADH:ubiquinone oxidoreductase subunit I/ferredoxin